MSNRYVFTCNGGFDEYLKYNNPHKFSLYLAARVSVIVWSQSTLANFVRGNEIGLCRDCLQDLKEAVPGIGRKIITVWLKKKKLCVQK